MFNLQNKIQRKVEGGELQKRGRYHVRFLVSSLNFACIDTQTVSLDAYDWRKTHRKYLQQIQAPLSPLPKPGLPLEQPVPWRS